MMHNRRNELDHSRRDPRERDSSPAGMSRKRPSMLSEFQGKHVYSDRDRSRVYGTDSTYTSSRSHDYYHGGSHRSKAHMTSSQGGGSSKYGGPSSSSSYHRPNYNDPRHHSYRHFTSRPNNDTSFSSDLEPQQHFSKRAKIHEDGRLSKQMDSTSKSFINSSSNASTAGSGSNSVAGVLLISEPVSPQCGGGLSQYISDIESDDDVDVVAQLDKQQQQRPLEQVSQLQVLPPQPLMPPQHLVEEKPPAIKKLMDEEVVEKKEQPLSPPKMTKEELLLLMERVDHDIAKVELQVSVLKKKEAELADAEAQLSNALPPATPPSPVESRDTEQDKVTLPVEEAPCESPSACSTLVPEEPSVVETILTENQRRVKCAAESLLTSLSCAAWMTKRLQQPLYWQPCEAPGYHERIERHKRLRHHLVQAVRKRKVELHKRETKLCEHYDTLLSEWEKKVEKVEGNAKRKAKDMRNKEFFEKHFPEIKRHTLRLGPKGFSVVRSEAELNEILDELYEQEEALDRYQRAHAPIPPMILNPRHDHKFLNTNGLVRDPLLAHKEQRMSTTWTDEEKQTFCEKFIQYPKCFEKIAQFIPNKTTAECIQFYYLSKKKENYKELVAKVKDQKRKAAILARQQLAAESGSPGSSSSYASGHLHKLADEGKSKSKPRLLNETQAPSYTGWTADEIQRLRDGLRLYGRAWGKIYRMVGPVKTATQCKSFFDDYRDDPYLQLHKALAEHNVMKNAQKAKRKAEARKQSVASLYEAEKKRRKQKEVIVQESSDDATDEIESDRDSVIESSVVSEEKTFSDTTTEAEMLSSHTDSESSTEEADEVIDHQATMQRTRPSRLPSVRTSEDNIDLLFSAAEALASVDSSNGIVGISTKVALRDHTYAKPTGSLTTDFQGTSGLSLIAAAAAVVSPTMSSSPTGKSPLLSPVKAPRGRPPSSTKRNSAVSTKLGPTFLSPAGPSMHISLTDTKSYRGRGRGTNMPLTKTISHASKSSGITTKLTIPANRVGKASVMSPTAGASKFPPFSTGSNKSSSLPHPITQQGSTLAAFEALVNVAAAAKPAELPPKSLNHTSSSISSLQATKKDNVNVTDVTINSTGTPSPHLSNTGITVPNLRLPPHTVSPKQTTLVMSTTNKAVRPLQKPSSTTIAAHSPLESPKNIYIGTTKSMSGKGDMPLRTLTVYAPMLAAQQNQSSTATVSSNSLVMKRPVTTPTTSGAQHTSVTSVATKLAYEVASTPVENRAVTSSSVSVVKPAIKPSVFVKAPPKADQQIVKAVEPAVTAPDNKKDLSIAKVSQTVGTATIKANPLDAISKTSDNKPTVEIPCVEADEENELPLRITLGQGVNSSSLVPISISRPPEGEVKVLSPRATGDDLPKLHVPLTKAAKKVQKVKIDRDKPKAKKTRTSDEFEAKKEQIDLTIATTMDTPASSDFLNVLIPSLVSSSASTNFTTGMFLNSLTSTTGALPSRNITHIMDRSHTNSPATDLINSATAEPEDHLVSAAHDISELSKLLEPVAASDQSNLDQCKTLDVASEPGDFCPDATALSLFSYIPDGSTNNTSEQQNSTAILSVSTVTTG